MLTRVRGLKFFPNCWAEGLATKMEILEWWSKLCHWCREPLSWEFMEGKEDKWQSLFLQKEWDWMDQPVLWGSEKPLCIMNHFQRNSMALLTGSLTYILSVTLPRPLKVNASKRGEATCLGRLPGRNHMFVSQVTIWESEWSLWEWMEPWATEILLWARLPFGFYYWLSKPTRGLLV